MKAANSAAEERNSHSWFLPPENTSPASFSSPAKAYKNVFLPMKFTPKGVTIGGIAQSDLIVLGKMAEHNQPNFDLGQITTAINSYLKESRQVGMDLGEASDCVNQHSFLAPVLFVELRVPDTFVMEKASEAKVVSKRVLGAQEDDYHWLKADEEIDQAMILSIAGCWMKNNHRFDSREISQQQYWPENLYVKLQHTSEGILATSSNKKPVATPISSLSGFSIFSSVIDKVKNQITPKATLQFTNPSAIFSTKNTPPPPTEKSKEVGHTEGKDGFF
jgi:hypothetical protein